MGAGELSMVEHTYIIPETQEAEEEDHKFKTSLGNLKRPCQKEQKKKRKKEVKKC